MVGPSFKEISARYASDSRTVLSLTKKIREGGKGVWGQVPMPPNSGVPEADARALVGWILKQK